MHQGRKLGLREKKAFFWAVEIRVMRVSSVLQGSARLLRPSAAQQQLGRVRELIQRTSHVAGLNAKRAILAEYNDLTPLLQLVYEGRFHLTSRTVQKFRDAYQGCGVGYIPSNVTELLHLLNNGVRGRQACQLVNAFIEHHNIDDDCMIDTLYRCIDRHLRVGLSKHSIYHMVQRETSMTAFLEHLQRCGHLLESQMPVALARTWDQPASCPPTKTCWYASRKLDGIRCLFVVTYNKAHAVYAISRTGRRFHTLTEWEHRLTRELAAYPSSFVIDGEMCVMNAEGHESFARAMSTIQQPGPKPDLVYFPFDLVTLDEFTGGGGRPYSERLECLRSLVPHLSQVGALPQTRIDHPATFEALVRDSREWEGLMLREDVPYEGRRTPSMLKIRPRCEAEYTVLGVDIRTMRLASDGIYADRRALASITIQHGGRRVSVGSGFRAQERIHFAKYPEDILGHTVTVSYMAEAPTLKAQDTSLRFPVVKHVYREGRTI